MKPPEIVTTFTPMAKRWNILPPADGALVKKLSAELGISPRLAQMLVRRGVSSFAEAKHFFRPSLSELHDPMLMKDMDIAVERFEKAIAQKEKILVYGDYDVDGTTAVSLVYSFLSALELPAGYYIPDRYREGYGMSMAGMDYAAEKGYTLIIALDCGIKDGERIAYAASKGIDVIVCDHHRPGDELPPALAVLDPKRDDCTYPFRELSGCGIGLKLLQAYTARKNQPVENLLTYFDLVAVSIAADVVPVTGENRVLAYYGLQQLNKSPRPGFDILIRQNMLQRDLTISDLSFVIAPRINAAGRIAHGSGAVDLLTAPGDIAAEAAAESINRNNTERKDLDTLITQQALDLIASKPELISRKTTVVFDTSWHKGVVGIVASRLTEKYYRPTVVLAEANGLATGSARSVKGFDVYEAIEACSDLLEHFGGHQYAAGLTLKTENVELFSKRFEEVVSKTITDEQLIPEVVIESELPFSAIDGKFVRILKQFSPFGPGNSNPVFMTTDVRDRGTGRLVGNNHLRLELMHDSLPGRSFPAIGFQLGEHFQHVMNGQSFSVCYTIEENEWNGVVTLQLNIKDIRY